MKKSVFSFSFIAFLTVKVWGQSSTLILPNGNSGILSQNTSVVSGNPPSFSPPASGAGTRFMWMPAKSALRFGTVTAGEWEAAEIGLYSFAAGVSTKASGLLSTAFGNATTASGAYSLAVGTFTKAVGNYAASLGFGTQANGLISTTMGQYTVADGELATAMGYNTKAKGIYSTTLGNNSEAIGENSLALGYFTTARAHTSVAMGRYNVISGTSEEWFNNDPLLAVGNGTGEQSRNNALTLLKNANLGINTATPQFPLTFKDELGDKISFFYGNTGNTSPHYGIGVQSARLQLFTPTSADDIVFGFGNSANLNEKVRFKGNGNVGIGLDNPSELLDVFGRMRVRHKPGNTAGVWMSNSANSTNVADGAFYGMKLDTEAGIFIGSNWRFWVTNSGNGTFTGTVSAAGFINTSDARFKKNITGLTHALAAVSQINGVRYDWRREEFPEHHFTDRNQIGFIAQEIEKVLPEMVFTDEKGYKSVDYARLTPVLTEAIKELKALNEALYEKNERLEARLNKIESLLNK